MNADAKAGAVDAANCVEVIDQRRPHRQHRIDLRARLIAQRARAPLQRVECGFSVLSHRAGQRVEHRGVEWFGREGGILRVGERQM